MKHRIVVPLPFAPDVVMRALTTTQFHLDKVQGLGPSRCELLEDGGEGQARFIRIRRRMPNRPTVPGALARLLPSEVVLHHRDEWNAKTCCGDIDVRIEGTPVRMRAAARVVASGSGSEQCFDWDIQASVPLLGGAMERFVAQDLDRSIHDEARVVRELLARYV